MWKILGIAPTRDIKEIKSAYARLAKQYNPEEKPEEFKQIFEAYKAACIYAKSTEKFFAKKEHKKHEGNETEFISRNVDDKKDTSAGQDAQGYDFSAVDVQKNTAHNENPADGNAEQEYDFSTVDVQKNTAHNENPADGNAEQGYDFSAVDGKKNTAHNENPADGNAEQEYDFSAVGGEKKLGKKENAPTENFDFSSIDPNFSDLNGMDRTSSLRIYLIRKLKKIFDSRREADIKTWQSFFYDTYFDELVFDVDFRLQAREVFFHKSLPHLTAKLVAEKFGAGTQFIDEGYGRYTVIISDGRNNHYSYSRNNTARRTPPQKKDRKDIMIKIIVAAVAIAVLWGPMIFLFVQDPESMTAHSHTETNTSPGIITLPPYEEGGDAGEYIFEAALAVAEEQTYEEDFLYESCRGKWLFDFGYMEFADDHKAKISFNGEVSEGTVFTEAASKGAVLYMLVRSENEDVDGMKLTAHIFSAEGRRLICTDRDGNEYTGVYEQKKENAET